MSDTPSSGDPLYALAPRKALAEDVVEQLRLLIVQGHFEPGAHLREQRLAAALNISRGPIRQALGQLEREGLVMRRPNRGSVVARLSREDLEEVYSIRLALEPLALSWAAERATAHDFERLEAAVSAIEAGFRGKTTVQEAAQLDVAFHDVVYDAAHHQRLKRVWSDLRSQVYLFLLSRRYVGAEDFGEFMVRQHVALVDALRTGDPVPAREIGESHVRASYRRVIEGYEKNIDVSTGL